MAQQDHFFYVSRASDGVGLGQVNDILSVSQRRNAQLQLTGMLLYTGSHFAQVLEGTPQALDEVIAHILSDRRHHDVRVLCMGPLPEREFSSWSLGYVQTLGTADLVEQLVTAPDVPAHRARRLIKVLFQQALVPS